MTTNRPVAKEKSARGIAAEAGGMPATASVDYAKRSRVATTFDRFASLATRRVGSPLAFAAALAAVLVWGAAGPYYHYSEPWQIVINTGTTIVTFLMVFLIQQSQNKDSVALHLKLDELLASNRRASNRLVGIEDMDDQDLRDIAQFYARLAEQAKASGPIKAAHSIDDAGLPTAVPIVRTARRRRKR
jgi:low affinity Fe/Cu permease